MPSPSPSSITPGRAPEPSVPARPCAARPNSTPGAIPTSTSAATPTIASRSPSSIAPPRPSPASRSSSPSAITPLPCSLSDADHQIEPRVQATSIDQRITAALAEGEQPRTIRRTARILPRPRHNTLSAPRRDDRRRHRHEIRQRLQPHRSLNHGAHSTAPRATPKQFSKSPRPRTLSHHGTAPPPLPASASHTPYSQREAEAGSPSKSATATPSNSVIVLSWQGTAIQSALPSDVCPSPGGSGRLHAGIGMGEGPGREPGWSHPGAFFHPALAGQSL